ncbi:hypothetical protein LDENG_00082420 [Lucifuga dentata]|nr:hypothetical protein LDENG_00082420 [Lucifuga dentata]
MEGLVERGVKQVFIQDSVNHTYSTSDDYTLHVKVFNQYDSIETSIKISLRPQLDHLLISSSSPVLSVLQLLQLEVSAEPSTYGVLYTWDFGDGSGVVQGIDSKVSHTFVSAGVYNVTVHANNSLAALTTWIKVEVMENISGLTLTSSGPTELNSATDFRAEVATGTSLIWDFDFGDGSLQRNQTDGSISHIYKSLGNYTVDVNVSNSVSQAHQSVSVEVYQLAVCGMLPTECIMSGSDTQLSALVIGNLSTLSFHWRFGDGSPLIVVKGNSGVMHTFSNQGIFPVNLTVFSSVTSVSYNTSICVEAPITNITVQASRGEAAAGVEVCFKVSVSPKQTTGYQFKWFSTSSSSSRPAAMSETSQKCFVFEDEGVKEVSVTASNKVSSGTAKASITIQRAVSQLSMRHDGQSDTLTVNAATSFWVDVCNGSNVSVLWDFGDGSPVEQKRNASHVFTSTGQFTVTATAFNAVSRDSVALKVNVLLPVSDLSLHTNRPYAVVGEEALITAVSSAISSTSYYWTVHGTTAAKQGTYQFRFVFPKPGVYQVRVVAQNLVSRREAAILIEVFERIEDLYIECQSLTNRKYIPTQEELLFTASVSKGSNVTYHWFTTQRGITRETTGDGESFHLLVETPGNISIQLRAANKLGETTSILSAVAVQCITSVTMTTQENIVALGKSVNISVSVVTGSDLQYLWYVNSDLSPMQTHVPFLLHTFTDLGLCLVKVSVQNVLSLSNVTKKFVVQEEVGEVDFEINRKKPPFYISTSGAVQIHGFIHKGSDLHWNWKVDEDAKNTLFKDSNQTLSYTFTHAGIYQVSLNVSNGINWQIASHSVTVQDAIKGLMLNISRSTVCTEDQVIFTPAVTNGSNVSFIITFDMSNSSQDVTEGQFVTSNLPVGRHLIWLKAWNRVSAAEMTSSVKVVERIQGLRLVNCCSAGLEAMKEIHFTAEVQSGFPVSFSWMLHFEGSEPSRAEGPEVTLSLPESGSLSVSVEANNGICSQMLNETVTVQLPVKTIKLLCDSERIFSGYAVTFSAEVDGGSNLRYHWDFGDSTVFFTDFSTASHTYHAAGNYNITIKVFNHVSHVSAQLHVEVKELRCSSPHVSLVQGQSTIFRSTPGLFEATVDTNCSAYKISYLWEIFRQSDCSYVDNLTRNRVILSRQIDVTSLFLSLPKRTLEVGEYCLVFTVSLQGTPLLVQRKTKVTVVRSALVAAIKGGTWRLWPSLSDLVLDGSESKDPDVDPGGEDKLRYHWTLITENSTESQSINQLTGGNSRIMTVLRTHLHPGTVYIFTLTVHKEGRRPVSATQSYLWSTEDRSGAVLSLDELVTSTGRHSPNLVVRPGVLHDGQSYTFTLNVSQPGRAQWGGASLTILPNHPPHGGKCDLSPESDIRLLETLVTYNCSGWHDDDSETSQLIYTFQVTPCHPASTRCSLLTLYRGTRSGFGSLVPVGSPGRERDLSVITVTLLIEDHLGSKVVALNRTLTVESPAVDEVSSRLRNRSQTELWVLVQHGNPQEIISYSVALTSQLNQLESTQSVTELMDRREIRENVTRALTSLPISSLLDVDQISSALAQSTAVPAELVCNDCQEKVLEAVEKMIRVMEAETSVGVWLGVDTGRNILSIIDRTLAALSESAPSPSMIALSALHHAGALMRSLMRSRLPGEAPILLFTHHISTVGFQGNPSDLLCTQTICSPSSPTDRSQTFPLCQFHIPLSLADHLKSQRSEVVQVVFGIDGALGSNPLLTEANPPISTSLVAMEFSTPQGRPIPVQDLDLEQAIRVTLPNKRAVGPAGVDGGGGHGREGEGKNETSRLGLMVTLPSEGRLNFMVKAVEELDEDAGIYLSFSFGLAAGAAPLSLGHVDVEVNTNASQDSLVRAWALSLPAATTATQETIFLSPLLNGTNQPVSVSLNWSLVDGGPVQVSVCVFTSLCQYYNMRERRWSSEGLRPLEGSSLHAAHCLTQHLTMFGASVFVHPGAVVLLPPVGGPVRNVLVGVVSAVLLLIHLLVGLIAYKLDHLDSLRLSWVPLCGRPGLYQYRVLVKTGWRRGAGTTAHVGISLYGVNRSGSRHLQRDGAFQRSGLDHFHLETDDNLGEVWKIRIWHDNTGLDPSWYVQHVVVWDLQTDHMFFFLLEDWLSVENQKNGTVEKEVLASCPEELSQFSRVLSSQLLFGMVERHLWLSLWERPTHSRFTRGQRVTCSALLLHLYLALGALWYGAVGTEGHSGLVSAQWLLHVETVAMGMTVAALVFPLQCLLCFLFRKAHSQVTVDMSVPPSPGCHSVEMDVYLGQSDRPSFLSLAGSPVPVRDSPSSLVESKAFDSSILDFWAASGLAPQKGGACLEDGVVAWPSYDSLLNLPADPSTKTSPGPSSALGPTRHLRRKKALMQLRLASPSFPHLPHTSTRPPSKDNPHHRPAGPGQKLSIMNAKPVQTHSHNLTTSLTLSEEDLLMSIAAAAEVAANKNSKICNSDSGRDSPQTSSSLCSSRSVSCSSWSERSEENSLYEADIQNPDPEPCSCSRSQSVARGPPGRLLPAWALSVTHGVVAALLGGCLAVVVLYGSFFSRTVVLMWLISALSAFLTSALLLEPLKVCVQALLYAALWRPVDPEVEDCLVQEVKVMRAGDGGGKVRPPCGYGLLQAKQEARKARALQALMRHCVCELLFLLLLLMLNYQDGVERRRGRLLHAAVTRRLHLAPQGAPNLTSLRDWSDAEQWINLTLVPHLHQNPSLLLVGTPRLQRAHTAGPAEEVTMGNSSVTMQQLLRKLHMAAETQFKALSIDFTHYHRESALFVCVSIKLEWTRTQRIRPSISIHPLFIPSSSSEADLQVALTVLLLLSALLILFGELRSIATERAQYLYQGRCWFQLLLGSLSIATATLQLCFLSQAKSCLLELRSQPDNFNNFHVAAFLAKTSSQFAAVLLTLLVLKLLGTLRFVRRWVVIGRMLWRTWRKLWALMVLMLLLLLLCAHLGNVLFSSSVEGFLSVHQAGVSVLSILRGRVALQRLCRAHMVLGPLYGLLVVGGGLWFLARLCGAVLIHTYREEQAEMYRPAVELQDYEMVEFFIKRLKLWMGLTKAKEFRHRVRFEGMDIPPSRSSQESRLSTLSSTLPSSCSTSLSSSFSSPRPLSSALSVRSEDSLPSEPGFDVQPYLDRLLPCVSGLLSRFDRVNQLTEDVHDLEMKLEEAQTRRRKRWIDNMGGGEGNMRESRKPQEEGEEGVTGEVRHRKKSLLYPKPRISLPSSFSCSPSTFQSSSASVSILPRTRSSYSESESFLLRPQLSGDTHPSGSWGLSQYPTGSPGFQRFPRRRAWHSGGSHSADAAQRVLQTAGGVIPSRNGGDGLAFVNMGEEGVRRRISEGIPVKRKAWISEGPENEQD